MRYFRKATVISLALGLVSLFYLIHNFDYITLKYFERNSYVSGPLFNPDVFSAGTQKPPKSTYSRTLVMGRLSAENVSWVAEELPGLHTAIYVVDANDGSQLSVPANKGHEAMVYLTYIIDHYDNLPDIVLFFHAHKTAWHNNAVLSIDSVETIRRISSPHIIRQGYMNTRCHLDPGCPNWLHVDRPPWFYDHRRKPEEPSLTSDVFHALHPNVPIPKALSNPCCAQFAVSGERIRGRPLSEYIRFRDWILSTPLHDATSGRLMEYSWQYIFTGLFEFCPAQHVCYCDGYGICFGDEAGLQNWLRIYRRREKVDRKLESLSNKKKEDTNKYRALKEKQTAIQVILDQLKIEAIERGRDPRNRAIESGREWKEGDGY